MGPVEGELVLFCQHADISPRHIWLNDNAPYHWFKSPGCHMIHNGKPLMIEWISMCNECFIADAISKNKFIGRHAPWIGEPPDIKGVSYIKGVN